MVVGEKEVREDEEEDELNVESGYSAINAGGEEAQGDDDLPQDEGRDFTRQQRP